MKYQTLKMTPKSGLERGGNLTLRLTSQGVLGKVDCQQTLFAKCRPSRIFRLGRHNLVGSRFKKMTSLTPWQMLYTLENSHVQPIWTPQKNRWICCRFPNPLFLYEDISSGSKCVFFFGGWWFTRRRRHFQHNFRGLISCSNWNWKSCWGSQEVHFTDVVAGCPGKEVRING